MFVGERLTSFQRERALNWYLSYCVNKTLLLLLSVFLSVLLSPKITLCHKVVQSLQLDATNYNTWCVSLSSWAQTSLLEQSRVRFRLWNQASLPSKNSSQFLVFVKENGRH